MANNILPRLLEVSVEAFEPDLWKWQVCESQAEIKHGFERTRETAQIRGDSALFELLSENLNH
jgi:hypothetical protein